MKNTVRVRLAPSPTGVPHVGTIRTAIFNWLFARGGDGSFIIRVEDTDQTRFMEGSIDELLASLQWLGIDWDEGPDIGGPFAPYYQSERLRNYHEVADLLVNQKSAYHCYCSPKRLEDVRKKQSGYDRRCRYLSDEKRVDLGRSSESSVIRFAMPLEGQTVLNDLVRGTVKFENNLIDDFVMIKSDGFPTYHLANVIDDQSMDISHVFRAEEWLSSTPRHLGIYDALGWDPPLFAHFPQILAPDRSKLSKRHGATSIQEYRAQGFMPDAIFNFLALLGWSLDDKTEIMSSSELKQNFSLERVAKSGAMFDVKKLEWMNGHYIRQASLGHIADSLLDYWQEFPTEGIEPLPDRETLMRIMPLIHQRIKTLRDATPLISFFFQSTIHYDINELVQKNMDPDSTKLALLKTSSILESMENFDASTIENTLRNLATDLGIKAGQLFGSIRVATTGLKVAPPLFETLEVLGKNRSIAAISIAAEKLQSTSVQECET